MNNIKRTICSLVAFVAIFCGASYYFFQPQPAYAEELPEYKLAITPTQRGLGELKPGETYSSFFKVKNMGKNGFSYKVTFTPYTIDNEDYDANYTTETKYSEITKWITVDKEEGFIEAGGEIDLNYEITVPQDAHGGAQVGTIMVAMQNQGEQDGTGVQTVRRLGYLVYGNVDGEITATAKILENKIPSFIFAPPITATSLVENTGNVYTNASYSLQVFPLFGDEEVYTNEEDPEKSIVFPETKRFFTASWEGSPQLGIFRVRQTVKIFDEVSTVEKLVFICPIWFLFIVVLIIFVAIFWLISRICGRNKE